MRDLMDGVLHMQTNILYEIKIRQAEKATHLMPENYDEDKERRVSRCIKKLINLAFNY